ncbi:MAG: hypothetical protein AAGG11_22575 [Pseudomonadota bacterium]
MQVGAETGFPEAELKQKLIDAVGDGLEFAADRQPPKFWLRRFPGTFPAAAEVTILSRGARSEVVLRLMWGPLPALVPRAGAAAGLLAGLTALILGGFGLADLLLAAILVIIPGSGLLYQRAGEQELMSKLARCLGVEAFVPTDV